MDLTPFTQTDTHTLIIIDPITGKDMDVKITVYGMDTKEFRNASAKQRQDKSDHNDLVLLASLTKSWENIEFDGDKNMPCTHDNAFKIYRAVPFLTSQVEAAIFNRVNFMKGKG